MGAGWVGFTLDLTHTTGPSAVARGRQLRGGSMASPRSRKRSVVEHIVKQLRQQARTPQRAPARGQELLRAPAARSNPSLSKRRGVVPRGPAASGASRDDSKRRDRLGGPEGESPDGPLRPGKPPRNGTPSTPKNAIGASTDEPYSPMGTTRPLERPTPSWRFEVVTLINERACSRTRMDFIQTPADSAALAGRET